MSNIPTNKVAVAACPFCGGTDTACGIADEEFGRFWVECICGARGPTVETLKDARPAWNKRLAPEPREQYESGWVIEGAWSPTDQPDYWVGSSAWSTDPYKALRFANQQSAQQAAELMCSGINTRFAMHEWAAQPETKGASDVQD